MANSNHREDFSDEVLAGFIQKVVLETEGVYGFAGGISNSLSKNILGRERIFKGIRIDCGDEGDISADLDIYVEYGARIPAVAWDVQTGVKKEIRRKTGIETNAVNINVKGVRRNEKE